MSFGELFVSLSFFLIASALMLTALMFVFGIQQRAEEIGILLGVGWPRPQGGAGAAGRGECLRGAGGWLRQHRWDRG